MPKFCSERSQHQQAGAKLAEDLFGLFPEEMVGNLCCAPRSGSGSGWRISCQGEWSALLR